MLLKECLDCLNRSYVQLDDSESKLILLQFSKYYPRNVAGRIDWEKVANKKRIYDVDIPREMGPECYIIWDEDSLPILKIQTNMFDQCRDDILAVDFDTRILDLSLKKVIEFYHDNEITIGTV